MDKYYAAYEERYRKVHANGLLWFIDEPTEELAEWVRGNSIGIEDEILEVGCGEGRDSVYLAQMGYKVVALDISNSAVEICRTRSEELGLDIECIVDDIVNPTKKWMRKFKWIVSIGTYHMLVEDEDQNAYLQNINRLLESGGKFLLINKGNGIDTRKTDINEAYKETERTHMLSGKVMNLASTSFRQDKWEELVAKVESNGFEVQKQLNTRNINFDESMTLYLAKKVNWNRETIG